MQMAKREIRNNNISLFHSIIGGARASSDDSMNNRDGDKQESGLLGDDARCPIERRGRGRDGKINNRWYSIASNQQCLMSEIGCEGETKSSCTTRCADHQGCPVRRVESCNADSAKKLARQGRTSLN